MGQLVGAWVFAGEPPAREVLVARLRARYDRPFVEEYAVAGSRAEIGGALDAIGAAYVDAVMRSLGGQAVHPLTAEPRSERPPWWSERPWRSLTAWQRLRLRLGRRVAAPPG